jgi:hypothetical protein
MKAKGRKEKVSRVCHEISNIKYQDHIVGQALYILPDLSKKQYRQSIETQTKTL